MNWQLDKEKQNPGANATSKFPLWQGGTRHDRVPYGTYLALLGGLSELYRAIGR